LTPDGRRVVFVGGEGQRKQIYVRDLRESEAKPVPNTEDAEAPFLSPDGRWVGFWADEPPVGGVLKRVALDGGGPPVEICPSEYPFGASWGDDGTIVFSSGESSGLWRVSSEGGAPEVLTTPGAGEYGHRLPHVMPGGRAVLFTVVEQPWNWESARVVVHQLGTKGWQVVVSGASDGRYVPTGHVIFGRRGRLMAAPFNPNGSRRPAARSV
jgi:serine/threonine-protein kinase